MMNSIQIYANFAYANHTPLKYATVNITSAIECKHASETLRRTIDR